jgi:hypothetical protein
MLVPVGEQKNSLRLGMKTFEDEQERIRRAEQARLEEEARKAAEEAALAQAVALEQNGHKAAAEAVIAAPVVAPAVYVPKTTPTGFGNATRRTWGAEVTDLMALVKAVAAGTVPIQALEANTVFLNGQARMLKAALAISRREGGGKMTNAEIEAAMETLPDVVGDALYNSRPRW